MPGDDWQLEGGKGQKCRFNGGGSSLSGNIFQPECASGAIFFILIGTLQGMIEQGAPQFRGDRCMVGNGRPASQNSGRAFGFPVVQTSTLYGSDQIRRRVLPQQFCSDLLVSGEAGPRSSTGAEPCQQCTDSLMGLRVLFH